MGCPLLNWVRGSLRHELAALTEVNFAIIPEPLGWVTVVGIHVSKRYGEMNKVKIKVIETPVLKLFLC
jgi:hypothetical protein